MYIFVAKPNQQRKGESWKVGKKSHTNLHKHITLLCCPPIFVQHKYVYTVRVHVARCKSTRVHFCKLYVCAHTLNSEH